MTCFYGPQCIPVNPRESRWIPVLCALVLASADASKHFYMWCSVPCVTICDGRRACSWHQAASSYWLPNCSAIRAELAGAQSVRPKKLQIGRTIPLPVIYAIVGCNLVVQRIWKREALAAYWLNTNPFDIWKLFLFRVSINTKSTPPPAISVDISTVSATFCVKP